MHYTLTTICGLYFFLLICSFYSLYLDEKKRTILFFFIAVVIGVFYGLRDLSIGYDTSNYVNIYLHQQGWVNIGLRIINAFLYPLLGENGQTYLLVISLLTSINIAFAYKIIFKDNNKYICFAYTMLYTMPYMILMQINIMRQGLAASFVFLGFLMWTSSKNKLGILLMLLGCLTHYSMFFLCIAFLFIKVNDVLIIYLIAIFLILSITDVSVIIMQHFPIEYVQKKAIKFLGGSGKSVGIFAKYAFYLGNYALMLIFSRRLSNDIYTKLNKTVGAILLIAALIYPSTLTATRFMLSIELILPVIYFYPHKIFKEKKIYIFLIIFIVIAYFAFTINTSSLRANLRI